MRRRTTAAALAALLVVAVVAGCRRPGGMEPPAPAPASEIRRDPHSFSRPHEVAVRHLELDLAVDFEARRIRGEAALDIENRVGADRLFLDTRDLEIRRVLLDGGEEAAFTLGPRVPGLGRQLAVEIRPDTRRVRIGYATRPEAAGLQWLEAAQTAGRQSPFLFTQSQAILARTWVPCQDTPGVRMTYAASVRVPAGLMAVMSADNPTERSLDATYSFSMPQPIPSYLLALAVGDLTFRPLGERTGVYAEPAVIEEAAWEFADVERMLRAAEDLYGPYRWGRYDLLVLPPSFPFGGMENPRLTFVTPTILAGDRSLVALVAHELAHSWSGNLVTNATWNDFWLNEGVTTYIEHRLMEELYGRQRSDMLWVLSLEELKETLEELGSENPDTHLYLDLEGRDPDDGMTDVAYVKGALFLRHLEEAVGRGVWDAFLSGYFDTFAFQSIRTARFVAFLKEQLLRERPALEGRLEIGAWIYGPGLPRDRPGPRSAALEGVEAEIVAWREGTPASELETAGWSTQEWLHFLQHLPERLTAEEMARLDAAFRFTASGNAEILAGWFELAIRHDYRPARPALEEFLIRVGRRKFLKPLYTALAESPGGLQEARRIYARARPGYHAVARRTIDQILAWGEEGRPAA